MTQDRRLIHASGNGDRWWLCRDAGTEVQVLHEPNAASGGRTSLIPVGRFLTEGRGGPEQQALLQLIGTLVSDREIPCPAPEPGAAAAEPTPGENFR